MLKYNLLIYEDNKMQPSFSEMEYAAKKRQTRRDIFLTDIEAITPWNKRTEAIFRASSCRFSGFRWAVKTFTVSAKSMLT